MCDLIFSFISKYILNKYLQLENQKNYNISIMIRGTIGVLIGAGR